MVEEDGAKRLRVRPTLDIRRYTWWNDYGYEKVAEYLGDEPEVAEVSIEY